MLKRMLIGFIVTIGVGFLLALAAARGLFGSYGWAVALIVGSIFCAAVAVALVPLSRRRHMGDQRLHILRR